MMEKEISILNTLFRGLDHVKLLEGFASGQAGLHGKISIHLQGQDYCFRVVVPGNFPLTGLLFYYQGTQIARHLLRDGLVCASSPFNTSFAAKLEADYGAVVEWVEKYVIKKEDEGHYEYLPISVIPLYLLFDEEPKTSMPEIGATGEFLLRPVPGQESTNGLILHTYLADMLGGKTSNWSPVLKNFHEDRTWEQIKQIVAKGFILGRFSLVQYQAMFSLQKGAKWPMHIPKIDLTQEEEQQLAFNAQTATGVFIFLGREPINEITGKPFATIGEFWEALEETAQAFILDRRNLWAFQLAVPKNIPIALGYQIPGKDEVHWECLLLPSIGEISDQYNQQIIWCKGINACQSRFFGRGKLDSQIAGKSIMILGTGAIGSTLAETLVRGGATTIDLIDPDVIEAGNICRSTYSFKDVHSSKAKMLAQRLVQISPFVDVKYQPCGIAPAFRHQRQFQETKDILSPYDLIFDCTAEDSVAWMLDQLQLPATIINLSITDKARQIVAVTNTGKEAILPEKRQIFSALGQEETAPTFYEGLGCWHPTFQASYADINLLLQHWIADANHRLEVGKDWQTTVLERKDGDFGIRVFRREDV